MGYGLVAENGRHRIAMTATTWSAIKKLAYEFGWEPEGTVDPNCHVHDWDGNYWMNEGQQITASDAHNFGAALERALSNLADCSDPELAEYFAPAERHDWVRAIIDICKEGALRIL